MRDRKPRLTENCTNECHQSTESRRERQLRIRDVDRRYRLHHRGRRRRRNWRQLSRTDRCAYRAKYGWPVTITAGGLDAPYGAPAAGPISRMQSRRRLFTASVRMSGTRRARRGGAFDDGPRRGGLRQPRSWLHRHRRTFESRADARSSRALSGRRKRSRTSLLVPFSTCCT